MDRYEHGRLAGDPIIDASVRDEASATEDATVAPAVRSARFAARMSLLFLLLGIVIATVAVQVYRAAGEFVGEYRWVVHTYQVKESISSTVAALRGTEAAVRAYALNGTESRLAEYYATLPAVSEHSKRLRELVADNPAQSEVADALERLLVARKASMAQILDVYRNGGLAAVQADPSLSATSRQQDADIDSVTERLLTTEDTLLAQRESVTVEYAARVRMLTAAAIALCFAILALTLVITLREHRQRVLSERQTIASYADLARSLDASRQLGETMRQLTNLGEMLQGCRDLDEAAIGLQTMLARMFPRASGTVALLNASQNLVVPLTAWGEKKDGDGVFAPDDCWALRRGRPHPEDGNEAFVCRHVARDASSATASSFCLPLMAQGTMLGTLAFTSSTPLADDVRSTAIAASEQVSLAIANLRLQETLRTQSLRDPLTNLFNRRYLEVSLSRDLARSIRRSQPLAVLMIDVDHFKTFNDTHGHEAGDAVLASLGELLASLSRNEDVACRYGGEEFTLVLQEADSALALDRAEEIRRAAGTIDVRVRRQAVGPISVSIGIASYPQHGDTPDQLLKRADRALYTAKNQGRNRVCVADR
jgi:diguanylate cyclase (GGDEF)-like protein